MGERDREARREVDGNDSAVRVVLAGAAGAAVEVVGDPGGPGQPLRRGGSMSPHPPPPYPPLPCLRPLTRKPARRLVPRPCGMGVSALRRRRAVPA